MRRESASKMWQLHRDDKILYEKYFKLLKGKVRADLNVMEEGDFKKLVIMERQCRRETLPSIFKYIKKHASCLLFVFWRVGTMSLATDDRNVSPAGTHTSENGKPEVSLCIWQLWRTLSTYLRRQIIRGVQQETISNLENFKYRPDWLSREFVKWRVSMFDWL